MDDRELEIRRRAEAALEGRDELLADLERRAAYRESVEGTLARADAALARRETAPQGQGGRWPTVEIPEQAEPASMRHRRPYEPARARDWTAEQRWIEQIIDQRMTPVLDQMRAQLRKERQTAMESFADGSGEAVAELLAKERVKWRAEIAASQAVLEKRIASLQKRLRAAEKAAAPAAAPAPRMLPHVA